jgi:putative endonuclease
LSKYFVYCLYSESRDRLYIGHTDNLERRYKQHTSGNVVSTKPYRPYKLIYHEELPDKKSAMKREFELKKSAGRIFLRKFINNQHKDINQ